MSESYVTIDVTGPVGQVHEVRGQILQQLGVRARDWVTEDQSDGSVRCRMTVVPPE
jgi:hypothetical protein